MRRLYSLPVLAVLTLLSVACERDSCEETWTQVVPLPVTLDRAAVQDSITALPAREFCTGGNLYAYGDYLFVNSALEGYHLLDNSDPSDPRPVAFLRVPGATQMAFVDGRMVSDSYADLVVLDFAGPEHLTLLSSTPNFLLEANGFEIPSTEVAVGFEDRAVEFTQTCDGRVTGQWGAGGDIFMAETSFFDANIRGGGGGASPAVNTAGSLARLAFCDASLYVLGTSTLATYHLGTDDELVATNNTDLGWGQETMIRRGDFLYVASQSALTILGVSGCGNPELLGTSRRWVENNDPVAVEGDRAVATLRWGAAGDEWAGGELVVYDVTDRTNPTELNRVAMTHPVGVALHDGILYVCDDVDGVRVFDFVGGPSTGLLSRELQTIPTPMLDVAVLPYPGGTTVLTIGEGAMSQFARGADGTLTELVTRQVDRCARS